MKPERFALIKELYIRVSELPDSERKQCLDEACQYDPDLRQEVESLLSGDIDEVFGAGALRAPPEPDTTDGPSRIGSYEIVRKLGEGGMAVVYEARQKKPRRTVALKIIKGALFDRSLVRRFDLETSILGKLNHPGIARVYDAGETDDGIPFLAMEYVPGLQLVDYAKDRDLDVEARLELMARVLDAVQYAHEAGVIHRDLKPANILVTDDTTGGFQPKVLDFGVAKAVDAGLETVSMHTSTGQLIGTLAYMSPEQVTARSEDLDARSDVYQLGIILYELLAGKRPYEITGLPVPEAGRVIAEEEPLGLGGLDSRYRGDIDAIVSMALYKEKERRYPSAARMAEDIRRYLNHEPITARPASGFYRIRRLAVRRKDAFTGLAAGLAIAVLLVAVLLIRGNERRAEEPAPPRTTQLTALPRDIEIIGSSLSPDGTTLAFTQRNGLFLQDISTKEISKLPLPDGYRGAGWVRWHPTTEMILVRLHDAGGGEWYFVERSGEIERATPASVSETLAREPRDVRISPDGNRMLLMTNDWRSLWVVNRDGNGLEEWITLPETSYLVSPVWSPNGETIAFIRSDEGSDARVLSTVDARGNILVLCEPDVRLTQRFAVAGSSELLCWLPDGRLLVSRAMAAPNSTSSEITVFEADQKTGAFHQEAEALAGWAGFGITSISASTTGDRITIVKRQNQDDVFLVDLDDEGRFVGESKRLTLDTRIDRGSVWDPKSERIFFMSTRFGPWQVLSKRPGDPTSAKFAIGADHESFLELAPGGEALLIVPRLTGSIDRRDRLPILRVPLSGGDPEPLVALNSDERIHCGSELGAPCFISRPTTEGVTFLRLDETWNPAREVGSLACGNEDFSWAVAPDGRELAVITNQGPLEVLDIETGEWHLVCKIHNLQTVTYAQDGNSFYVTRANPYEMLRITRDGESERIWQSTRDWVWDPRVSPNGKQLAFNLREFDENVWLIEDF